MTLLQIILIILGAVTLVAIILYASNFNKTIIKSTIASGDGEMDQYYYLPHAQLSLKATATVLVEKSAGTQNIISHKLLQISFEPSVLIRPDPECRVSVVYEGNWFSSDEFQLVTSSNGLLDNLKLVSDDRLSSIVARLTHIPSDNVAKTKTVSFQSGSDAFEPVVVEVIQETRVFTITSNELSKSEIKREWFIPIKGLHNGTQKMANAGFTLKNEKTFDYNNQSAISYAGLLTRPLVEQTWTLDRPGLDPISFTCQVPDTGALVKIPVSRSHFIKRQQLPKFQNGILVENTIVKPSEFEGMISIPVNILKAIVSIPAQLFQFKISRVRQETEYDKALLELAKARNEIANSKLRREDTVTLSPDLERLRNIPSNVQIPTPTPEAEERLPMLGKLPASGKKALEAKRNRITTPGEDILLTEDAVIQLPAIEDPHSWAERNSIWDEYDNYEHKTCVPASGAYLLTSWTCNSRKPTIFLSPDVIMETLRNVAPGGDITKGCDVGDFLVHWRDYGMGDEKITDSFEITPGKPELLKHAIYWFGGCIVGLRLPISMKKSDQWIYDGSLQGQRKEGHAVCAIGYDDDMFTVISFGKEISMDAEFYRQFNDETFLVLSATHWTAINGNKAPTKPPASFDELLYITGQLTTL